MTVRRLCVDETPELTMLYISVYSEPRCENLPKSTGMIWCDGSVLYHGLFGWYYIIPIPRTPGRPERIVGQEPFVELASLYEEIKA